MSRITKQNEKYLARVRESLAREKDFHEERKRERNEKREMRNSEKQYHREMEQLQRDERNMKITESNNRYSDLWIATTGISVPQVINLASRGGDAGMLLNKLDLRLYDHSTKASVDMNLITFVKMLHDKNFPHLLVSKRGQVKIDDMVIPARAYNFIRYHWLLSQTPNQYNLNNENASPSTVPTTTTSDD